MTSHTLEKSAFDKVTTIQEPLTTRSCTHLQLYKMQNKKHDADNDDNPQLDTRYFSNGYIIDTSGKKKYYLTLVIK